VSLAAITLCVASQRVFIVVSVLFRYRLIPETFGYILACNSHRSRIPWKVKETDEILVLSKRLHETDTRLILKTVNYFNIK
jgi:hypothetical protein